MNQKQFEGFSYTNPNATLTWILLYYLLVYVASIPFYCFNVNQISVKLHHTSSLLYVCSLMTIVTQFLVRVCRSPSSFYLTLFLSFFFFFIFCFFNHHMICYFHHRHHQTFLIICKTNKKPNLKFHDILCWGEKWNWTFKGSWSRKRRNLSQNFQNFTFVRAVVRWRSLSHCIRIFL